jgi:glycerol-3-phosphate acyltransferase PlsX
MSVRIAVDGMGGDRAPGVILEGIELFIASSDTHVTFVCPRDRIENLQQVQKWERVTIEDCKRFISMDCKLSLALFKEKNTTVHRILQMVKDGHADVAYSAGNTAVFVSLAVAELGMVKGIERPAIVVHLPNARGSTTLFLDVGANVSPKPNQLYQYALMGSLYARYVFGLHNPSVGLLNIGEEPAKGDELRREAYQRISADGTITFIGNIEGYELFTGKADIVVSDGFCGNVILKVSEGITHEFKKILVEEIKSSFLSRAGYLLARSALRNFARKADYSEYGGGVLLGVDGIVVISHGRSSPRAIQSGLNLGRKIAESAFINTLKEESQKWAQQS